MRKVDIVRRIAKATDLTLAQGEEAVNAIFDEIKIALQQGDSAILRRFGAFQVRDKRARIGRNPKTGQEANISARRVVQFKAGTQLKDTVNGLTSEPVKAQI